MKAINQSFIVKTIIVLFAAITFQSCSSSEEKYVQKHNSDSIETNSTTKSGDNTLANQEELEQAAALLLLAAIADEINNSTNETYAAESNYSYDNKNDYNDKDDDEGSQMIKDRIETEIGSNIVYE
jgi:hypothetical protein